jgi:hypothetical protein
MGTLTNATKPGNHSPPRRRKWTATGIVCVSRHKMEVSNMGDRKKKGALFSSPMSCKASLQKKIEAQINSSFSLIKSMIA